MWCHKHLKSLPCPHQKAVPFSLSSPLTCSLPLSTSQARACSQLQNAPNAFTEEWGCLKGSTYYGDCRVVSLRPDHDNHCFFIYRKVSDFLFPLCQPTGCYRCALELKHHLEGLIDPFHFEVFTVYIFRWSTVSNSGWSALSQAPPRTHLGTVFTPLKRSKSHPGNTQQWENIKCEV